MNRILFAVLLVAFASAVRAQDSRPAFEVASVKVKGAHDGRFGFDYPPGGGITARNCTLRVLIQIAYDLRDYQQPNAPGWIHDDGFDIAAKPAANSGNVPREQTRLMLQRLLEERFHMTVHRETVMRQVYSLVVGKNGPKLGAEGSITDPVKMMTGDLVVPKMPMSALATIIGFDLKRPVLDETGLKGDFAFRLQWARARGVWREDPSKPSIFAAVQEQLGLKLNSTTGPIEVLVIDSVTRTPTEN